MPAGSRFYVSQHVFQQKRKRLDAVIIPGTPQMRWSILADRDPPGGHRALGEGKQPPWVRWSLGMHRLPWSLLRWYNAPEFFLASHVNLLGQ